MTAVETPWGPAQSSHVIAPGIIRFDTASHGGYYLSHERVAEMPQPLRDFQPFAGPGWYEEDADWTIVALAFPQFFSADAIPAALDTLKHYQPDLHRQMVELLESQGKHRYSIHYADRELAREQGDPTLGEVIAGSKDEAETLAWKNRNVTRRAVPCAGLWAVREERGR